MINQSVITDTILLAVNSVVCFISSYNCLNANNKKCFELDYKIRVPGLVVSSERWESCKLLILKVNMKNLEINLNGQYGNK